MSTTCIVLYFFFLLVLARRSATVAAIVNGKNSSSWQTLRGEAPLVIARGGFSGLFPSSSDASFNFAVDSSLQSMVLWCDVQLTKDAFVICIPDVTINGSTSIEFVYPNGSTTYVVNGQPTLGWFSIDYTLADLQNVTCK